MLHQEVEIEFLKAENVNVIKIGTIHVRVENKK